MMKDLKDALTRSSGTLVQDFFGAAALVMMLLVALNLPGFA